MSPPVCRNPLSFSAVGEEITHDNKCSGRLERARSRARVASCREARRCSGKTPNKGFRLWGLLNAVSCGEGVERSYRYFESSLPNDALSEGSRHY